jgi:hypothetical protein
MIKNVGGFDRIFRIVVGLAIIAVGIIYKSWWGAIGLIPLVTGLTSRCPMYLPFGLRTCKVKGK